ncbi:hypothetical protein PQQ99_03340 [Paraburkholderia sediminicola]|uniref:hypothetical protein n=1 Tax=Paraburkholderia sediminicola TaxID=458836 RepID=UPI0038B8F4F2
MRKLAYLLLSITLASPLPALALGNDNPDYDQCILQSLRNSESSMAAEAIRCSCDAQKALSTPVIRSRPNQASLFLLKQCETKL